MNHSLTKSLTGPIEMLAHLKKHNLVLIWRARRQIVRVPVASNQMGQDGWREREMTRHDQGEEGEELMEESLSLAEVRSGRQALRAETRREQGEQTVTSKEVLVSRDEEFWLSGKDYFKDS